MSDSQPGDLVEIWEGGSLVTAVLLGHEKGRWRVVSEEGRQMRIAASRIAHLAGRATPHPESGARAAAEHSREAHRRAQEVDIPALWEILVDAGGRHTPASLATLALGDESAASTSAVIRRLSLERSFFERKGDDWVARSREAVGQTLRRVQVEADRERRRGSFITGVKARLSGGQPSKDAWPGVTDRPYLDRLIDLAVHGDESVNRKEAAGLLEDLGESGPIAWLAAFDLLVRLGVFTEDENLEIRRFGIRTGFPEEVREAAARAAASPVQAPRRDLTHLTILTVDDAETAEIDDGLSWEEREDGASIIGVHIADPSTFVRPGDIVDEVALQRAATWYFPERRLTMLPPVISEGASSLVEGHPRPSLSFFLHLGPEAQPRKFEIVPSTIRCSARLTYDEAAALLEGREGQAERNGIARVLAGLRGCADRLRERRVRAGAVILRTPEVSVRIDAGGGIHLKRIGERGISRELVAEMMIQINSECAGFCATSGIPAIYRRQAPPQTVPEPVPDGPYDPVAVRTVRRGLRRGEVGLSPEPHYALGVPAYMQITSPLRRYQDLAAMRQIKAWLAAEPLPYDAEALSRIAATTEAAERAARQAESAAESYWILKHLAGRIGEQLEGIVIHAEPRRTVVELCDTLTVAAIPARPDHAAGLRLRLIVEEVRPRLTWIRLREAAPESPPPA